MKEKYPHKTFKMAAERRDCDQLCEVWPRPHFLPPRRALPVYARPLQEGPRSAKRCSKAAALHLSRRHSSLALT